MTQIVQKSGKLVLINILGDKIGGRYSFVHSHARIHNGIQRVLRTGAEKKSGIRVCALIMWAAIILSLPMLYIYYFEFGCKIFVAYTYRETSKCANYYSIDTEFEIRVGISELLSSKSTFFFPTWQKCKNNVCHPLCSIRTWCIQDPAFC